MLSVRKMVFACALLAVVPFAAVAEEPKAATKMPPAMLTAPAAPVAAPATTRVCQLVPTMVEETRTVMKPVQKTETYTAYKTENVQEKKVVAVTTYKTETYTEMVTKTHCVKVPVVTQTVVMEKRKKIEWVTEYKNKHKLTFEKDCKTIGCGDKCGNGCGDKCGGDKCGGDKCGKGFSFSIPVYKPRLESHQVACTVPKCTYECVPVTKCCTTYKTETKTTCVPVCKTRCVPCTTNQEVVCCKQVCVPYQATRCVTVCEPCTEKVQVCKMVPTWVDVPCAPACAPAPACEQAPACAPAMGAPVAQGPACHDNAANNGCDNGCNKGYDNGCNKGGCKDKFKDCFSSKCEKLKSCCTKIKSCFCCK